MATNSENQNQENNYGKVFFRWKIPEFTEHQRSNLWYLIMIILAVIVVVYCIVITNYFFALIVILATFIVFLRKYEPPKDIIFQITEDGIVLGGQFFEYDKFSGFYILYSPPVKKIYFKLKGLSPDDLSIPLDNNNPLPIREKLLEYLDEDLNKQHQTISDILETLLKL
ncbi:MAG: hypothetical protein NTZ49_02670 [Candidatus Parcubacteria bacterium]|nr:hypothetical protein [Candidatus Parcubacteria bacterium]